MDLDSLTDPLSQPEFEDGLAFLVPGVAVAVVLGLLWRWRLKLPVPIAGLLLAGGTLLAIEERQDIDSDAVRAVLVLAATGFLLDLLSVRWRLPLVVVAVASAPGAWLLYDAGLGTAPWVDRLLGIAVFVGATTLADVDQRRRGSAVGPILVLVTVGGMYSTLPDTEQALALLGVSGLLLTGWPLRLARLGTGGAFATAGALAIVAALGGVGRQRSVVAAVACLGVVLVEPLAEAVAGRRRHRAVRHGRLDTLALLALHVVTVLVCARVAGLRDGVAEAATIAAATLSAALVTWTIWALVRRSAQKRRLRGR